MTDQPAKPVPVRLENDFLKRIDEYCSEHQMSRSSFIRMAISKELDGQHDSTSRLGTIDAEARDRISALEETLEKVMSVLRLD